VHAVRGQVHGRRGRAAESHKLYVSKGDEYDSVVGTVKLGATARQLVQVKLKQLPHPDGNMLNVPY
jgi:hypothetical protein